MSRWILIVIAILALVGILLAHVGVIHVRNTENDASITVDKKELKEKTHDAVEKTQEAGGEILDKAGAALRKAGEGLRQPSHYQRADSHGTTRCGTRAPAVTNRQRSTTMMPWNWRRQQEWGYLLLGIWLLATGLIQLLGISVSHGGQILAILAVAAGALLLMRR